MRRLASCATCSGFLGRESTICPHCSGTQLEVEDAPRNRLVRGVVAAATGGAVAITLMACYGAAPTSVPYYDDDAGADSSSDARIAQDAQVTKDAAPDAADASSTDAADAGDAALDGDAPD